VPVDDLVRGHAPIAFVVLAPDAHLGEADIQKYARSEGPTYQFPRRVFFLDALPLAGTNKIDHNALIDQGWTHFEGS
jgi:acyl-CoA synthetase (AMP-forming)/AMP-acid ligase II